MKNAGLFRHKICIVKPEALFDSEGYPLEDFRAVSPVLTLYAQVKAFKGSTLIRNDTDFEKATTAFIFRKPVTPLDRKMLILYKCKVWEIQYLNEEYEPGYVEIQAKEVRH